MSNVSLKLGPATVTVPNSFWSRIGRAFRRRDSSERVLVLPAEATLRVQREDEGEIEVGAVIANFNDKPLVIDSVAVSAAAWISMGLPELPWIARGTGTARDAQGVSNLWMSVQLNVGAIRRIKQATPTEAWRVLGGGTTLRVSGVLNIRGARRQKAFELYYAMPAIQAFWLQPSS